MRKTVRRLLVSGFMTLALALTVFPAVSAQAASLFPDVDYRLWYAEGTNYCNQHGLITGYDNGYFGVGDPLRRAQLAAILWRVADPQAASSYDSTSTENTTGISDVESHAWYTGAANWAVSHGVINGYDNDDGSKIFAPNDVVTLEQMVTIIGNYCDKAGAASSDTSVLNRYTDASDISSWAQNSVAWGTTVGLVSGYDNADGTHTLQPQGAISRERAATILMRACQNGIIHLSSQAPSISLSEAQKAYDQAKQDLEQAQERANAADAQRAKGSVGFFEYLGDYEAENVFKSTQVVSGTGTDADGHTFASYTRLGTEGDATSLDNMKAAIDFMREGNQLRTTDNNVPGLGALMVTNDLMALSEMNANWLSRGLIAHAPNYGENFFELPLENFYVNWGENIAARWGGDCEYVDWNPDWDPFEAWYTEEKKYYDDGEYGAAGHYLNIINSRFNVAGYGRNTDEWFTGDSQFFGQSIQGPTYSVETYASLFNDYYYSIAHAEDVVAAKQAALDQAQRNLDAAR